MASITRFIESRLRLSVNAEKSAVARPEQRHFLGFSLSYSAKTERVAVLLSKRSRDRIMAKIKQLTPRTWGASFDECVSRINAYLRGWIGFFGVCTSMADHARSIDSHLRRRVRALLLRQRGRKRNIARWFIQLGVRRKTAWQYVYRGATSLWALSKTSATHVALSNAYLAKRGLLSLNALWSSSRIELGIAPRQLTLPLG